MRLPPPGHTTTPARTRLPTKPGPGWGLRPVIVSPGTRRTTRSPSLEPSRPPRQTRDGSPPPVPPRNRTHATRASVGQRHPAESHPEHTPIHHQPHQQPPHPEHPLPTNHRHIPRTSIPSTLPPPPHPPPNPP